MPKNALEIERLARAAIEQLAQHETIRGRLADRGVTPLVD
jgi:hypothetical protein